MESDEFITLSDGRILGYAEYGDSLGYPIFYFHGGHEKLMERILGNSLKLLIYIMKYENEAIRLSIVFYKPKDKWLVNGYEFDARLIEDFKDSVKVDQMNE